MDGRVQIPVIDYLRSRFKADYVDTISEPGPNRILADGTDAAAIASIERRLRISVDRHHSVGIAVVGHHDCAGNPTPEAEQRQHTLAALRTIRKTFTGVPVIGLWVDDAWTVSEVAEAEQTSASA
jgi:hypothetical protein